MKYSIGEIVILLSDKNIMNRYIVIATEKQVLDQNYLKSLSGKLNIKNIEKLAEKQVNITEGFKYKICKCAENYSEGFCVLEGNFIDVIDDNDLGR